MRQPLIPCLLVALGLAAPLANAQTLTPGNNLVTLQMAQLHHHTIGRVAYEKVGDYDSWAHAWPGTEWVGDFKGSEVVLRFDDPYNQYRIEMDGKVLATITKPGKRDYRLSGLGKDHGAIFVEKFSENQGPAGRFGGFFVLPGREEQVPYVPDPRQIEFIGDSYTVGYGNTSGKTQCTRDEVWATTDTGKSFGRLTADHFGAESQINAISGRGIVRNYGAYPFTLFNNKTDDYDAADWQWSPQIIAIGLGTNDFSTPLHDGEKWKTRDDLHADYEATYVKFIRDLRAKNPNAFFILMAADQFKGEMPGEINKVIATLNAQGEQRIAFLPMTGLKFGGCDGHPNTDDDRTVSDELIAFIDQHPGIWQGR
jgi:lysophospholipase L1-like esterase